MFGLDGEQLKYKINHLIPWLLNYWEESGMNKLPEDTRDYQLGGIFGSAPYTPKSQRLILQTQSVKNQNKFNNCVFQSCGALKEIDEKTILSVRSLTTQTFRNGAVSENGFSNLRDAQKTLQDWGIEEEKDCPDGNYSIINDFNGYIGTVLDQAKASLHKIKTFWSVGSKDDILKLLDQGNGVHAAMLWFTGYNRSGGFSEPWLITKTLGYQVGGHAIAIIGYDLNYKGKKVFIIQNSYSADCGDEGKFYVDMDFMLKEINRQGYGAYTNLDLDTDLGNFFSQYNGKDVKGKNSPAIYHIQNGVKKVYLHEMDYFVWNVDSPKMEFELVDDAILNKVPNGDNMDITKSIYWPILQHLDQPLNITRVLQVIKENKIN